jgi:hypothetical protein
MADSDFSHHVSEIPAGPKLPEYKRNWEQVEVNDIPNIQNTVNNYADDTNWMSAIGSAIATKASSSIAQKIGSELGKKPIGDIGIPITSFDKTMQESYQTQAQATLGLQADKLITESNIETAKATRITPDLIAKTNQNISIGLKNIFKNAPIEVVPNLERQYGAIQLNQRYELTQRMIREQNDDRKNNTALAAQTNAEHAYSFGLSGNDKAGEAAIETVRRLSEADVASRLLTPKEAKDNVDTARQSYLSGKIIGEYQKAYSEGKGEEYLKSIADNKPSYLSDNDYKNVISNLMQHVNQQDSLRSQDQSLALAKFQTSIAMNPMAADMPQQLQELKRNVSPENYEKAQLYYVEAIKKYSEDNGDVNQALASWNNLAGIGEKARNKAFTMMTGRYVQQRQQQGNPISEDEAEVQIAASAGGVIPIFRDTIKNNLNSGNPSKMDLAARQMDALYSNNASKALSGLSDSDKSIYTQYKSLRDSLPPEEAAKIAIQNANQDPDTQKMNQEKWAAFVKSKTYHGFYGTVAPNDWALQQVGLNKDEFINPGIANEYGNLVLHKYATFYQNMNGDADNALKITKQEVDDNFGYTGVNGGKVMTLHPIEKVLGYTENGDSVPYIQQDVINNLDKSFVSLKEAFNKNKSNVYWDVVPRELPSKSTKSDNMSLYQLMSRTSNQPIQVKRYTRTSSGVKSDTYNVVLIGNSFNWDISLQTDSGTVPLPQVAPYLGIQTYSPNKKAIDDAYQKSRKG